MTQVSKAAGRIQIPMCGGWLAGSSITVPVDWVTFLVVFVALEVSCRGISATFSREINVFIIL